MNLSAATVVVSREDASLNKSAAVLVAAGEARVQDSATVLLLAKNVEGNVTTLMDLKSAICMGAVIGGVLGFVSLFTNRR
jgi:hypothetical protein